jgi:tetratricopeptide (TPR) repeat protein
MVKRKIGLVIGTNIYAYPGIKDLEFAEADARAIKDVLLDANLCGFDEVIEVIGGSHTEASEKIEKMLNDAEPDDIILLYFSGHGKLDMGGNLCLLFNDTKLDSLLSTSLHFDFINKFIKGSRCKTIIIIIDSCFSGAAGIRGGDELLEKSLESIGEGTIILSASRDFEPSKEDETLKHGVFTYYLWEGLKTGDADDNKDGLISIDELYRYANSKIKEGRHPQHPKRSYDGEGDIVIGVNPEIIKKNNFEKDVEQLIKKKDDGLPIEYYSQAMNILTKDYEKPLTVTDIEKKIQPFLESLLNNKMEIQAYITTIKVLMKGPFPPDPLAELNSQAKKLFKEKKYTEAIAKWQEVLKLDSENREANEGIKEAKRILEEIDVLNTSAQLLYDEGKYREAIDKWNEVLRLDPENQTAKEGIRKAEDKEAEAKLKEKIKKFCPKCGLKNERGLRYCTHCGTKLFGE